MQTGYTFMQTGYTFMQTVDIARFERDDMMEFYGDLESLSKNN